MAAIAAGSLLLAPAAGGAPVNRAKSQTITELEQRGMSPGKVRCSAREDGGHSVIRCRWEAIRPTGARCNGSAVFGGGKLRLSRVRCSLKAASHDARDAVRAVILKRSLRPGPIRCGPSGSGWICGWEAFQSIAGWRYRCAGQAHAATAAGPNSLDPVSSARRTWRH